MMTARNGWNIVVRSNFIDLTFPGKRPEVRLFIFGNQLGRINLVLPSLPERKVICAKVEIGREVS